MKFDETKTRKDLKIYSILFIAFAIIDMVNIAISCINGNVSYQSMVATSGSVEVANIILTIFIIAFALVIGTELYLGFKGLKEADGGKVSTKHITIAKIGFAIFTISLVYSAVSMFSDSNNFFNALESVASLIILYEYIKNTKLLLKK